MGKRRFTDEQEQEICRRYVAGEGTVGLGKAYGMSNVGIGALLKRNGIKLRTISVAKGGVKPELEPEICRRYLAMESTYELAKAYGVSNSPIARILKRNGIKIRTTKEAMGGLSSEQETEVCERYVAGMSSTELANSFGAGETTICRTLKSNGIRMRTSGESQGGVGPALEPEVCRRYLAGESARQLAEAFGVTTSTICRLLERNGIERRASGVEYGDSVHHVLRGTGLHTSERETEVYLFELARYSATHAKVGISYDTDKRAGESKGEYGDEILRLYFATRAEAFFLEQAVLDATRGTAFCPADLIEWIGHSEVREQPAADLVPVIEHFASELERLGVWEFAAAYVPMPSYQRLACQQRAAATVDA